MNKLTYFTTTNVLIQVQTSMEIQAPELSREKNLYNDALFKQ